MLQVLYGIQVRTLGWPVHFWKLIAHKLSHHRPCFMAGSIVMLIQTTVITELVFYRRQFATSQNVLVSFRVYISVQYYERAKSIPWETPPHCNTNSSKFHCWHYTCRQVIVLQAFATPKSSHRTATWYIVWFVTPNHTFTVVHCPVASLFTPL
jgi:hypothetical protein